MARAAMAVVETIAVAEEEVVAVTGTAGEDMVDAVHRLRTDIGNVVRVAIRGRARTLHVSICLKWNEWCD